MIINDAYWLFDHDLNLNVLRCRLVVLVPGGLDGYGYVVGSHLQALLNSDVAGLLIDADLLIAPGPLVGYLTLSF